MTALRREGADPVRKGRPWSLPLEDRVLLMAAYWRTNLTMRQLAPLFGISKSAADRIIDQLGPSLALQPHKRFAKDTVLIVDGTLVPTRDHMIAEQSKNYRYSTNHQVVIDADTRLVVVVGRPLPGNRNDCKAWEESGAKAAVGAGERRVAVVRTRHRGRMHRGHHGDRPRRSRSSPGPFTRAGRRAPTDQPGRVVRPSWRNIPMTSQCHHPSVILPSEKAKVVVPSIATRLPVGGTPRMSPVLVPRHDQRVTTRFPSAIWSSTANSKSGNARR